MVRISNLELIKILKQNSKISYVKLAKHFKVSETAIRKRIKNLEREKIIKRYTIDVDPRKMGFEISALIGIDTLPEHYLATINKLKKTNSVLGLYSSSGDHMIMIESWFKNSEELSKFVSQIEKWQGITKICPAIILEKIK